MYVTAFQCLLINECIELRALQPRGTDKPEGPTGAVDFLETREVVDTPVDNFHYFRLYTIMCFSSMEMKKGCHSLKGSADAGHRLNECAVVSRHRLSYCTSLGFTRMLARDKDDKSLPRDKHQKQHSRM